MMSISCFIKCVFVTKIFNSLFFIITYLQYSDIKYILRYLTPRGYIYFYLILRPFLFIVLDTGATLKADSSNKSNTSESKKNNTASTSNSSSNKNNSSSSSSKPAEHTHNWVAQYKTVNVPEKGHNEQVLVQAAYDEQVPVTEMKAYSICNDCGADITGNTYEHVKDHMINDTGNGGYHTEWRETVVGYNTVHHDAVYETRYVVDSPATTKQELTGYKCSSCGKTKAN